MPLVESDSKASIPTDGLRSAEWFAEQSDSNIEKHLVPKDRDLLDCLSYSCRIIALHEEDAGLAGQISARSTTHENCFWTLKMGIGFEEATPEHFVEVDGDLNVITGRGMANPATRFHLWVYRNRPDVNSIVHTHSPYVATLAAAGQSLVIAQMDMTPLHNDCAYLAEWPGLPIADEEGVIISAALGDKKTIIMVNHGQLTAGRTIQEAAFLSVYLERAARIQVRAAPFGSLKPVSDILAKEAHDFFLKDRIVRATFDYWARQTDRRWGQLPQTKAKVWLPATNGGTIRANGHASTVNGSVQH